jgi:hypothetical protein
MAAILESPDVSDQLTLVIDIFVPVVKDGRLPLEQGHMEHAKNFVIRKVVGVLDFNRAMLLVVDKHNELILTEIEIIKGP